MKFISLFAGIGGFDLGFERAGMQCVAQVEIDPFCQKVLAKHWPDVPRYGDIRNVGKHNLPKADVICGGFPCQPFSFAGNREGSEDDRYLWPEMLRVIQELKPSWVVGENVPGIINLALDEVLASLENEGYSCETFIIPACAINAPHKRDRVWIVANSIGNEYRREKRRIFGETETVSFEYRQKDGTTRKFSRTSEIREASDRLVPWQDVAYSESGQSGEQAERQRGESFGRRSSNSRGSTQARETSGNSNKSRLEEWQSKRRNDEQEFSSIVRANWWAVEPGMGRVANGVPSRVDRLRSLGNAVVPQIPEIIARSILQAESHLTQRAADVGSLPPNHEGSRDEPDTVKSSGSRPAPRG